MSLLSLGLKFSTWEPLSLLLDLQCCFSLWLLHHNSAFLFYFCDLLHVSMIRWYSRESVGWVFFFFSTQVLIILIWLHCLKTLYLMDRHFLTLWLSQNLVITSIFFSVSFYPRSKRLVAIFWGHDWCQPAFSSDKICVGTAFRCKKLGILE